MNLVEVNPMRRLLTIGRLLCGLLIVALVPLIPHGRDTKSASAQSPDANPVVLENQHPGSTSWFYTKLGNDAVGQIKGYSSVTSVTQNESITFHVTVNPAQAYTIDFYRMGWYGGMGARLRSRVGPLFGVQQPPCHSDQGTGLIECNWAPAYTLTVPSDWTSGVYLAKLTNAEGYENYVVFVVKDGRPAPFLYQHSVSTDLAYNNYPNDGVTGKSLYSFNSFGANTISGNTSAVKVSFDRPMADAGLGGFINWGINLVRWLERSGYDVTYADNLDTHANGSALRNHKAFLSAAHDEYWSKEMYDAAEGARDAGVNLAFFGANSVYTQVRFEPSAGGAVNRVMVCYRSAPWNPIDPVQGPTTTSDWRAWWLNRPEQTLTGVQYSLVLPNTDYVVTNSSHWVYAGTGFQDGDVVPGIVGYEADSLMPTYQPPNSANQKLLSHSPFTNPQGVTTYLNSSIYQAPSGAWVFGSGTMSWSWALDDVPGPYAHFRVDSRIQRTTENILNAFLNGAPPTITSFTPATAPAATTVTIRGTDFTGATAVSFNGIAAGFTVTSATEILTTVPVGATAGPLNVTAPGGTATSATNFTVSAGGPLAFSGFAGAENPLFEGGAWAPLTSLSPNGTRFQKNGGAYPDRLTSSDVAGARHTALHPPDQYSEIVVGRVGSPFNNVGPTVRVQASGPAMDSQYVWWASPANGVNSLYRIDANGTTASWHSLIPTSPVVDGDRLRLIARGGVIYGLKNGVRDFILNTSPHTPKYSSGAPGMVAYAAGAVTNARIAAWSTGAAPVSSGTWASSTFAGTENPLDEDDRWYPLPFYLGFKKTGGQVSGLSSSENMAGVWSITPPATQYSEVTLGAVASGGGGPIVRIDRTNAGQTGWLLLLLASNPGSSGIYKLTPDGRSSAVRVFTPTLVAGDKWRLTADGDRLEVFRNGASQFTFITDGSYPAGDVGIHTYTQAFTFTGWEGGDTAGGALDTTPPTAPSNLTARATSSSQIDLAWTASTDNVGVTAYVVERCQGTCSQVATVTEPAYNDTGLALNTSYSYQVLARDAASNTSSYSNEASATTLALFSPPTITGFTPASGTDGDSLTISGTNFTGATAVTFNGSIASFSVTSATAIQATVPAGATTGPLRVTTDGGTATSAGTFTVSADYPLATSSFADAENPLDEDGAWVAVTSLAPSGSRFQKNDGAYPDRLTSSDVTGARHTAVLPPDHYSEIVVGHVGSRFNNVGPTVRVQASGPSIDSQYVWWASPVNGVNSLYRIDANGTTATWNSIVPTSPVVDGDRLRLIARGGVIYGMKNGVRDFIHNTAPQATRYATGSAGMLAFAAGAMTNAKIAAWSAGAAPVSLGTWASSTFAGTENPLDEGDRWYPLPFYRGFKKTGGHVIGLSSSENMAGVWSIAPPATQYSQVTLGAVSSGGGGPIVRIDRHHTGQTGWLLLLLASNPGSSGIYKLTPDGRSSAVRVFTPTLISGDRWRLTADGDRLEVLRNGVSQFTYITDGSYPAGDVGIHTSTQAFTFTEWEGGDTAGGTLDTTPPTAPSNLTAEAASSSAINLTWTASTDNVGVTAYLIERCQAACSQVATAAGAAYNDTGLAPNTSYSYQVLARDAVGNISTYSNVASATTAVEFNPPTITSFAPTVGPAGTEVTINGTAFTGATAVTFNGSATSFTVSSATAIQVAVPPGATTGPLNVTTPGGTATSVTNFAVSADALAFSSFAGAENPLSEDGAWVPLASLSPNGAQLQKNGGAFPDRLTSSDVAGARHTAVLPPDHYSEIIVGHVGSPFNNVGPTVRVQPSGPSIDSHYVWWASPANGVNSLYRIDANGTTATWHSLIPTSPVVDGDRLRLIARGGVIYGLKNGVRDFILNASPHTPKYSSGSAGILAHAAGAMTNARIASWSSGAAPVSSGTWASSTFVGTENPLNEGDRWYPLPFYLGFKKTGGHVSGLSSSENMAGVWSITPPATQYSEVTLGAVASGGGGPIVRIDRNSDGQTGWLLLLLASAPGSSGIYKLTPDGRSSAVRVFTPTLISGDKWRLTADGNRLEVFRNGVSQFAYTTDGSYSTGDVGIHTFTQAFTFTGWEGGDTVGGTPDTTPPTAPSNLTATAASSSQINLVWTSSTDDVDVTAYLVERCQGSCSQVATVTGPSYNDTGLTANTSYSYQVLARDAAGNTSPYSSVASATTPALSSPPTITGLTPSGGAAGGHVTISGTDFTGAMAVTFNGSAASFTVTSATTIDATVPTEATTGPLSVTTPQGTATSATSFIVSGGPFAFSSFAGPENPLSEDGAWAPLTSLSPNGTRFQKNGGAYPDRLTSSDVAGARHTALHPPDQYSEIVVGRVGSPFNNVGPTVRVQASGPAMDSQYVWWASPANGVNSLYRIDANGTTASWHSLIPTSPVVDGDRLRLIARGGVIYGLKNGVRDFILNTSPHTPKYSSGAPGMVAYAAGAVTNARIAAWSTGAAPVSSGTWASSTFAGTENPLDEDDRWYPLPFYLGFKKTGGQVSGLSSSENMAGVWSITPPATQYSEVTLGTVASGGGGPIVRIDRTNAGQTGWLLLLLASNPGSSGIYKLTPDGRSSAVRVFTPTLVAGDKWRLTADGDRLEVFRNGASQFTYTTDGSYPAGDVGIHTFTQAFTFTGWEGGDIAGATLELSGPTITGFTPATGFIGDLVVISGTNFTGATSVSFNGTEANFLVTSATTIYALVPTGATTGPLSVTTPGGTVPSGSNFAVVAILRPN